MMRSYFVYLSTGIIGLSISLTIILVLTYYLESNIEFWPFMIPWIVFIFIGLIGILKYGKKI